MLKSVLVTGGSGFVGRNLINRIKIDNNYQIFQVDRDFKTFYPYKPEAIDWVIHLASVHRDKVESNVYDLNMKINETLIALLDKNELPSNILFTSSLHENTDSYYGRSKKDGAHFLESKCNDWGKVFKKVVLPNLYGPYAMPYHHSVVANFCQDIVLGKKSFVNNVEIELLYINEALSNILDFDGSSKLETTKVFLPELYDIIKNIYETYSSNTINVKLSSKFEAHILTTLISYIK